MYLSTEPIPKGWALCDGNIYTYNNNEVQTPKI
jgi:microcystin-dependent protein